MPQDASFFNRLYSGFEAECLVMGRFFSIGLEAFKLPADFGFDLLVTNQMEHSVSPSGSITRAFPFPYAVQVKSRKVQSSDFSAGPSGRAEVAVHFKISESEFDLLTSEDRGYLICVAFLPLEQGALSAKALLFWLKGTQLPQLLNCSYLRKVEVAGKIKYDLKVVLRFRPTQNRDDLIRRLRDANHLSTEGARELENSLPEELETTWHAQEYTALYRRAWSRYEGGYYGERNVAKQIREQHLDLKLLGTAVQFPTDDDCESFSVRS